MCKLEHNSKLLLGLCRALTEFSLYLTGRCTLWHTIQLLPLPAGAPKFMTPLPCPRRQRFDPASGSSCMLCSRHCHSSSSLGPCLSPMFLSSADSEFQVLTGGFFHLVSDWGLLLGNRACNIPQGYLLRASVIVSGSSRDSSEPHACRCLPISPFLLPSQHF